MFSNKKWMALFGLVVIAALVLVACQPKTVIVEKEVKVTEIVEKEVEVTKIVEVEKVPEGKDVVTLSWNLGAEPPQVDPALSTDTTSVQVDEMLFLGLTDFDDETSEVIPELATEWSVSSDGLVWTFKMRNDVPWVQYDPGTKEATIVTDDEGNPRMVNAHDVEYAVKRTIDPKTASDYAYVLYIIKNAMAVNTAEEEDLDTVGVKAVDDFTVEFTLENPAGYFPGIASMWVARPVYAPAIDEWGARWVEPGYIVTNGPYLMDEWVHFDK
ncbi:MAG: hypothetical protein JXA89_07270, partial [Anaerolineae bacterium]|nr:hypothetical protein [Anaerolineae bacterium]